MNEGNSWMKPTYLEWHEIQETLKIGAEIRNPSLLLKEEFEASWESIFVFGGIGWRKSEDIYLVYNWKGFQKSQNDVI